MSDTSELMTIAVPEHLQQSGDANSESSGIGNVSPSHETVVAALTSAFVTICYRFNVDLIQSHAATQHSPIAHQMTIACRCPVMSSVVAVVHYRVLSSQFSSRDVSCPGSSEGSQVQSNQSKSGLA